MSTFASDSSVNQNRRLQLENARMNQSPLDCKTPFTNSTAQAKTSRSQRMQKLRALRRESGDEAKLLAFKLKRQQAMEAYKEKQRDRVRAWRGTRGVTFDAAEDTNAFIFSRDASSATPGIVMPLAGDITGETGKALRSMYREELIKYFANDIKRKSEMLSRCNSVGCSRSVLVDGRCVVHCER